MYIPNFYGIIKGGGENGVDLMALVFSGTKRLDNYNIEAFQPTYTDGSYFKSDGTLGTNSSFSYAVEDVSKYDFVFIPNVAGANVLTYSGLRSAAASGALTTKELAYKSGSTAPTCAYALFEVGTTGYACISASSDMKLPIIGLIES